MSDYLVTLMSGGWSVLVYEPGQPDATTAGQVALANLGKKATGVTLGQILQYDPSPSPSAARANAVDYLVTLTAAGGWSIQVYAENFSAALAASNAAQANLAQKVSSPKVGTSTLLSLTPSQAQLSQVA